MTLKRKLLEATLIFGGLAGMIGGFRASFSAMDQCVNYAKQSADNYQNPTQDPKLLQQSEETGKLYAQAKEDSRFYADIGLFSLFPLAAGLIIRRARIYSNGRV
jgi:hypothetical protein